MEEVVYGGGRDLTDAERAEYIDPSTAQDRRRELYSIMYGNDPKHIQYTLPGGDNYVELVLTSPQAEEMADDPLHFIEGPGRKQIGWIRGKEFTDATGERVFFVEEVQSKRHQEGMKKGYGNTV